MACLSLISGVLIFAELVVSGYIDVGCDPPRCMSDDILSYSMSLQNSVLVFSSLDSRL